MSRTDAGKSLQIEEHPGFQRFVGILQRAGWCVLSGCVVAALLGLLGGGGPLGIASVGSDPVRVDYARFARYGAPLRMDVEVATEVGDRKPFSITLGGGYGDRLQIENIVPWPERMSSGARGLTLEFAAAPGARQRIRIEGKVDRVGPFGGIVTAGGSSVRFTSLIYP